MLAGTEKCLPLSLLPIFPLLATYDCCASGPLTCQACYPLTCAASRQVNWYHLSFCSGLPSVAIVQLLALNSRKGISGHWSALCAFLNQSISNSPPKKYIKEFAFYIPNILMSYNMTFAFVHILLTFSRIWCG